MTPDPSGSPTPDVVRIMGGVGQMVRGVWWLFFLPILTLFALGGWLAWQSWSAVNAGERVTGYRVGTSAVASSDPMEVPVYYITYHFTDAAGTEREARSMAATNLLPRADAPVALIWSPETPDVVRSASLWALWGLPALMFGLGVVFVSPLLWMRRFLRRLISA